MSRRWSNSEMEALLRHGPIAKLPEPAIRGSIITDYRAFHVQPDDINAGQHLWESFDNSETEVSAGWLVRFCQKRGRSWEPFTVDQIEDYYRGGGFRGFDFNRLIEPRMAFYIQRGHVPEGGGWIVDSGNALHFTDEFVMRCFRASPKTREEVHA